MVGAVPFERAFLISYIGFPYYSSISTRLPEILDCSFEWGFLGEVEALEGRGRYHSKERW